MARHESRVPTGPGFLLASLAAEPKRYAPWWRGEAGHLRLFPRPGMWLELGALGVLVRREKGTGHRPGLGHPPSALPGSPRFVQEVPVRPARPSVPRPRRRPLGLHALAARRGTPAAPARPRGAPRLRGGGRGDRARRRFRRRQGCPSLPELCGRIARFLPPGERVLGLHHYWLGLARYDFRALDLAKVLSEDRYPHRTRRTLSQAIDFVDPGSIVIGEDLLRNGTTESYGPRNPPAFRFWRDLSAYLSSRCVRVGVVEERGCGSVGIYRRLPTERHPGAPRVRSGP